MNERIASDATLASPIEATGLHHPALVVISDPDGPEANAIRALRVSLRFASGDQPPGTILLASVDGSDNAGWLAANLATAFALAGDSTLLLDANPREPRLHDYFGIANTFGVANYLEVASSDLQVATTALSGLTIVPAGAPSRGGAMLATPRFATLLQAAREAADFVIVDAAPLAASADVLGIAPLMDGVVLVIQVGKTKRPAAIRVKEQLERVGARLLGVALTGVPRERGAGGY